MTSATLHTSLFYTGSLCADGSPFWPPFHYALVLNSDGSLTLAWTSCVKENGLDELLGTMGRACSEEECGTGKGGEVFLSRERHVHCLERAVTHLEVLTISQLENGKTIIIR